MLWFYLVLLVNCAALLYLCVILRRRYPGRKAELMCLGGFIALHTLAYVLPWAGMTAFYRWVATNNSWHTDSMKATLLGLSGLCWAAGLVPLYRGLAGLLDGGRKEGQ